MKIRSPYTIGVVIAASACFTAGVSLLLFLSLQQAVDWMVIGAVVICVFVITYFVSYTMVVVYFKKNKSEEDNKTGEPEQKNKGADEIDHLKQLEKYRKEFLGNVSHELKTPVFNIQGYIMTLLDGGLEDPAINRNYLERTERSIDRMISIVLDLEAISRLESGELELELENFNMVQLVQDVYEMQEIRAKQKEIKLLFSRETEKSVMVYADRKRIFDVINNLVGNSITYGNINGQTVTSILAEKERVIIEILDTGIGIEEKHLPRLFERFYRVDKARSRNQGGTGLGLAIVKHIVEAHKQKIYVSSEIGKSTVFTFSLEMARK